MEDTDTQAQNQPDAGGDEIAAEMWSALEGGRKDEAQAALDRRNAQSAARTGEGDAADAGAYEPAPVEDAVVNEFAQTVVDVLGPEGEALVAEWGGANSDLFNENVAYMKHAVEVISRESPNFLEELGAAGDNAALMRHAATYGRLLAKRSGEQVWAAPAPQQPQPQRQSMSARGEPARKLSGSPAAQHAELTRLMHLARGRGQNMEAARLDEQRAALSARMGDGAIVGAAGRTR